MSSYDETMQQLELVKKSNENKKRWAKNHPDKVKASRTKWRKNNPDWKEDPEKHRKYNRIYGKKNPHIAKEWRKNNPEKCLMYDIKRLEKLSKSLNMASREYHNALVSWSKTIKKLDNYMCKNCDSTENLNAHHIQPKKEFPELSLDLDNGVTLCEDCHGLVHGFKIYCEDEFI